jgi:Uma2 family endonuclease
LYFNHKKNRIMSAATTAIIAPHIAPKRRYSARKLPTTFVEYLDWQAKDGYYYEWANGKLLKIDPMIYPKQLHIVDNLTRLFATTNAYRKGDSLMPELRMQTKDKRARVPDISYWTLPQRREHAANKRTISQFIVEIISENDTAYDVDSKMDEYFDVGVRMVWHIFPESKKVYVFSSPFDIKVCQDNIICSAEEVIEGFAIPTKDIFKLP